MSKRGENTREDRAFRPTKVTRGRKCADGNNEDVLCRGTAVNYWWWMLVISIFSELYEISRYFTDSNTQSKKSW